MNDIIKTGDTKSEDLSKNTTFLYPESEETIKSFIDRICSYAQSHKKSYEDRFVGVIDGIFIDAEKFNRRVRQYNGDAEKIFKEIREFKERLDEKYGISKTFDSEDGRKITTLYPAGSYDIPNHHRDVVRFAANNPDTHYIVTSSHMGIYDVDQLMQLPEDNIIDYICETAQGIGQIMCEPKKMAEYKSVIPQLQAYLSKLPEDLRKQLIDTIAQEIVEPEKTPITSASAVRTALKGTTTEKVREAAITEELKLEPTKEGETKDDE